MELIHKLLLKAIEGEQKAESGYSSCRRQAVAQGCPGIASLFSALSRAEGIHAANHIRALRKNGYQAELPEPIVSLNKDSLVEKLQKAVATEKEEYKTMYPSFCKQIRRSYGKEFTAKIALLSFKWAAEAEKEHYKLLQDGLEQFSAGRDVTGNAYYLCSVCGAIHFSPSPPEEPCEVCGHDISFYTRIREEI